jgi:3-hydroxyisobutyrate dehydrogenase/2-hydroxy-3-oxopropionate reductase
MAERVLAAGHDVTVWNRTPSRAEPLVAKGAALATTPAEAARNADVVVTMLADSKALGSVLTGSDGVVSTIAANAVLIEMSTIGPRALEHAATLLPGGTELLDAPVLGSVPQAQDGTLRIFVGGDPSTYDRCMGEPRHLGPLGSGAAMKLVVNSSLVSLMTTLGEALTLADALDLDQQLVLDILSDSPIGATVRSKRELLDSGRYPPRFRLALAAKDARIAVETAEALGCDPRVGLAARSWLEDAIEKDLGDLDYSSVIAFARDHRQAL